MDVLILLCFILLCIVVLAFWYVYILIDRVADIAKTTGRYAIDARTASELTESVVTEHLNKTQKSLQVQSEFLLEDKKQVQLLVESFREDSRRLQQILITRDNEINKKIASLGLVIVKNDKN